MGRLVAEAAAETTAAGSVVSEFLRSAKPRQGQQATARGFAFALLNGVAALLRPGLAFGRSLEVKRPARPELATRATEERYFLRREKVVAIARAQGIPVATVVQRVARKLRHGGPTGPYGAQVAGRFRDELDELADATFAVA